MKEITVLSGKGGTGKTSVTVAMASLIKNAVFCDCDVEASNMHLILNPDIKEEYNYASGAAARIIEDKCTNCGDCYEYCRFDAIKKTKDDNFYIDEIKCESCRLCERVCKFDAIEIIREENSKWYVSDTRFGKLIHSKLHAGDENSGKLVSELRQKSLEIAKKNNNDIILNDGPPGIGCPVIASITRTDAVVIVTEPGRSGVHDMQRTIELIKDTSAKIFLVINKYDINPEITKEIEEIAKQEKIEIAAKLPFDIKFLNAVNKGVAITELEQTEQHKKTINDLLTKTTNLL